jgi:hypothetical protein
MLYGEAARPIARGAPRIARRPCCALVQVWGVWGVGGGDVVAPAAQRRLRQRGAATRHLRTHLRSKGGQNNGDEK